MPKTTPVKELPINNQLICLLIISAILGFSAGTWLFGVTFAPLSAEEFVDVCDYYFGDGEWKVQNHTCTPINATIISTNITMPFIPLGANQ